MKERAEIGIKELFSRPEVKDSAVKSAMLVAAGAVFCIHRMFGAAAFGAVFAAIGIMDMIGKKKAYPEEKLKSAGMILFGLFTAAVPLMLFLTERSTADGRTTLFLVSVILAALSLMGGVLLIGTPVFRRKMKLQRCTRSVSAVCTEAVLKTMGRGGSYYTHLWEYDDNGSTVCASDGIYAPLHKPEIGTEEIILVNPDDPEDIFRPNVKRSGLLLIAGILLALTGAFFLFVCITLI